MFRYDILRYLCDVCKDQNVKNLAAMHSISKKKLKKKIPYLTFVEGGFFKVMLHMVFIPLIQQINTFLLSVF